MHPHTKSNPARPSIFAQAKALLTSFKPGRLWKPGNSAARAESSLKTPSPVAAAIQGAPLNGNVSVDARPAAQRAHPNGYVAVDARPGWIEARRKESNDAVAASLRENLANELDATLRTAATTVEALGTADKLLHELRNSPRPQRDEKARQVVAALQASVGHDPSMANFRNASDPAKRAEIGFKILANRDKPESVLRGLLASFQSASTSDERAALFPAILLAGKKLDLLF